MKVPILEFYKDEGNINKETFFKMAPQHQEVEKMLKKRKIDTALLIFTRDIFADVKRPELLEVISEWEAISCVYKIYLYNKKFVLALCPVGGPAAADGMMVGLSFYGIKNFFACGSAGQVDNSFDGTKFVLVDRAIRDEGTSYHYMKPSVYVETDKELRDFIASYLQKTGHEFELGTTWTTDAFYRETPTATAKRVKQGAVSVEMECASWAAVAKYRGLKFAQLLYFSDAVKQEGWSWNENRHELKTAVIRLMIDCVSEFVKQKKC